MIAGGLVRVEKLNPATRPSRAGIDANNLVAEAQSDCPAEPLHRRRAFHVSNIGRDEVVGEEALVGQTQYSDFSYICESAEVVVHSFPIECFSHLAFHTLGKVLASYTNKLRNRHQVLTKRLQLSTAAPDPDSFLGASPGAILLPRPVHNAPPHGKRSSLRKTLLESALQFATIHEVPSQASLESQPSPGINLEAVIRIQPRSPNENFAQSFASRIDQIVKKRANFKSLRENSHSDAADPCPPDIFAKRSVRICTRTRQDVGLALVGLPKVRPLKTTVLNLLSHPREKGLAGARQATANRRAPASPEFAEQMKKEIPANEGTILKKSDRNCRRLNESLRIRCRGVLATARRSRGAQSEQSVAIIGRKDPRA